MGSPCHGIGMAIVVYPTLNQILYVTCSLHSTDQTNPTNLYMPSATYVHASVYDGNCMQ